MARQERPIPTLHLTCGLPCAGKTTLARAIEEQQHALRLTSDEWIMRLHGADGVAARHGAIRSAVEEALLDLAMRLLTRGVSVVLDFGVWARSEREDFRARAAAVGARSELHFLGVPLDELLVRLRARNADLPPGTYHIEEEELRLWSTWLEPPTADELAPREPPPGSQA